MAATSYPDRLLEPLTEAFTPEMASALLKLRADSELDYSAAGDAACAFSCRAYRVEAAWRRK